jgi:hypothetical protein
VTHVVKSPLKLTSGLILACSLGFRADKVRTDLCSRPHKYALYGTGLLPPRQFFCILVYRLLGLITCGYGRPASRCSFFNRFLKAEKDLFLTIQLAERLKESIGLIGVFVNEYDLFFDLLLPNPQVAGQTIKNPVQCDVARVVCL